MRNETNTYFKFTFRERIFSIEWRYCESIDESAFVVHETVGDCVIFKGYFCYDWNFSNKLSDKFMNEFDIWISDIDRAMCIEDNENTTVCVKADVIYEVSTTITEKTHKILSEKKKFFYDKDRAFEYMSNQEKGIYVLFGDNSLTKISTNSKVEKEYMSRVNNDICITIKCTIQHID